MVRCSTKVGSTTTTTNALRRRSRKCGWVRWVLDFVGWCAPAKILPPAISFFPPFSPIFLKYLYISIVKYLFQFQILFSKFTSVSFLPHAVRSGTSSRVRSGTNSDCGGKRYCDRFWHHFDRLFSFKSWCHLLVSHFSLEGPTDLFVYSTHNNPRSSCSTCSSFYYAAKLDRCMGLRGGSLYDVICWWRIHSKWRQSGGSTCLQLIAADCKMWFWRRAHQTKKWVTSARIIVLGLRLL